MALPTISPSWRLQQGSVFLVLLLMVLTLAGRSDGQTLGVDRCPSSLPSTTAMRVYNGRCYQFVSEERYWAGARDYCHQYGGRLVKVDDAATNGFLANTLNGLTWQNNGVWIGLHDRVTENKWMWTGSNRLLNEPATWFNWGRGHPGAFLHGIRDCVRMVRTVGQWPWHETPCEIPGWQYRFVCEYSMRPTELPPSTMPTSSPSSTPGFAGAGIDVAIKQKFIPDSHHHFHGSHHESTLVPRSHDQSTSSSDKTTSDSNEVNAFPRALQSLDQQALDEPSTHSNAGYMVAIIGSIIGAIVILAFIIYMLLRRIYRSKNLVYASAATADDDPVLVEKIKLDPNFAKPLSSTVPSKLRQQQHAESNAYEDFSAASILKAAETSEPQPADDAKDVSVYCPMDGSGKVHSAIVNRPAAERPNSSYLPMSQQLPPPPEYSNDAETGAGEHGYANEDAETAWMEEDGMAEYDMPRQANIYSEISDAEHSPEQDVDENIYESLDQVLK